MSAVPGSALPREALMTIEAEDLRASRVFAAAVGG